MQHSFSDISVLNVPLLMDNLDHKHTDNGQDIEDQKDDKQEKIQIKEFQENMDSKQTKMADKLDEIERKLSNQFNIVRQLRELSAEENRPYLRYLLKQILLATIGVALTTTLVTELCYSQDQGIAFRIPMSLLPIFIGTLPVFSYRQYQNRPGRQEVSILTSLPEEKAFLIEAGVIGSEEVKITQNVFSDRIKQRKRQFEIFKAPDVKEEFSERIRNILLEYDEETSLPKGSRTDKVAEAENNSDLEESPSLRLGLG